MKELVQYLARNLVEDPEAVEVSEVASEQTTVLKLKVSEKDKGRIIGKQGRTIRAIRALLAAASAKTNKRVILELVE